jgi:hypothetical protein
MYRYTDYRFSSISYLKQQRDYWSFHFSFRSSLSCDQKCLSSQCSLVCDAAHTNVSEVRDAFHLHGEAVGMEKKPYRYRPRLGRSDRFR